MLILYSILWFPLVLGTSPSLLGNFGSLGNMLMGDNS
jgi:hypothetical protein